MLIISNKKEIAVNVIWCSQPEEGSKESRWCTMPGRILPLLSAFKSPWICLKHTRSFILPLFVDVSSLSLFIPETSLRSSPAGYLFMPRWQVLLPRSSQTYKRSTFSLSLPTLSFIIYALTPLAPFFQLSLCLPKLIHWRQRRPASSSNRISLWKMSSTASSAESWIMQILQLQTR